MRRSHGWWWTAAGLLVGTALVGCAAEDGSGHDTSTIGAGGVGGGPGDPGFAGSAGSNQTGSAGRGGGASMAAGSGGLPARAGGSGGLPMTEVPVTEVPDAAVADAEAPVAGDTDGGAQPPISGCEVGPVPDALRQERDLDPFYQKYADANGIPILTSDQPDDRALVLACQLVIEMVSERDDVRQALIRNRSHFTIIGIDEQTTDTPEFSNLPDYYNTRARGLGGQVASCAEESIFCDRARDRWYGESICVHEYSHTISMYGLYSADDTFEDRLTAAYDSARSAGLWADTYAMDSEQEYWAEGVQSWYDTNLESQPPNGIHGPIDTKDELQDYDPALYELIDELLPQDVMWADCYRN